MILSKQTDCFLQFLNCFQLTFQFFTTSMLYTEVFFACAETEVLIDYIGLGTCALLAFSKTATFWYHSDKIFENFLWMSEDFVKVTEPKYREIMMMYTKKARKIFKIQMGATCFSAISFPVNALAFELLGLMDHALPMQTICTISNITGPAYPTVFFEQCIHVNLFIIFYT